jgi:diguanylate cyclase (GGDEF)-like protein/PAS domain S-box-containing protein
VDSATPAFFSQTDAERLEAFTNHAVVAIKNSWQYEQIRLTLMRRVQSEKTERNFVSAILDNSSAFMLILNAGGRVLRYNQTCLAATGYSPADLTDRYLWEILNVPEDTEKVKTILSRLSSAQKIEEFETQWFFGGQYRLIAWSSTILRDNRNQPEHIIITGHDITERKKIEEALRIGGERYALAVQAANDGLWDWHLDTNDVYFSSRWKAILGYQDDELPSAIEEWFSRVHPEDLPRLRVDLAINLEKKTPNLACEYRMRHRSGEYRWVLTQGLLLFDAAGRPNRLTGSQTDITAHKMREDRFRQASLHDALTGLPNRSYFTEHLTQVWQKAKNNPEITFSLLFIDLDGFKQVNDRLGHQDGDQLLMTIAQRLKAGVRPDDMVARLGGDEFTILLENIHHPDAATHVAQRLQSELAQPVYLEGEEIIPRASIGIALSTSGYQQPEEMLQEADLIMYQAKRQGGAGYTLAHPPKPDSANTIGLRPAEFQRAIADQEFQLYYQPIISLSTGQISAVEAVLRWQHPEHGLIMPNEFIPLAEESGFIIPLGEWVLRTACAQAQTWYAADHTLLRLAVNVSIRQFEVNNPKALPRLIEAILAETGLAAETLELEITETVPLNQNHTFNWDILNQLKALGLQIAMDDFGVNSPLGLLRQFPLTALKVDRSLIQEMPQNSHHTAITSAIINLAHELGLRVVVEGVETEAQLTWLQTQLCDEVQGFLFSPPVPAEVFREMLCGGPSSISKPYFWAKRTSFYLA